MTPNGFTPDSGLLGLAAIVLLLGLRHGFDADHLAAIDGLATHNAVQQPRLARLSGVLFSLGHGIIVVAVALGVSLLTQAWHAPQWLDSMGMWVSVCVLTLLALVNIAGVVKTPGHEVARVVGWRSGMFARLLRAGHPLTVLGVGAMFALSFDTISQAALFAVTAAAYGGWRPALLLGLLFTAGMLLTDGINGWLIWRLIRHSDRTARVASRTVALAVSGVGLLTAGLSLAMHFVPAVELWAEGKELWFGGAVVAIVLASYLIGQRLARDSTGRLRSEAWTPNGRASCG